MNAAVVGNCCPCDNTCNRNFATGATIPIAWEAVENTFDIDSDLHAVDDANEGIMLFSRPDGGGHYQSYTGAIGVNFQDCFGLILDYTDTDNFLWVKFSTAGVQLMFRSAGVDTEEIVSPMTEVDSLQGLTSNVRISSVALEAGHSYTIQFCRVRSSVDSSQVGALHFKVDGSLQFGVILAPDSSSYLGLGVLGIVTCGETTFSRVDTCGCTSVGCPNCPQTVPDGNECDAFCTPLTIWADLGAAFVPDSESCDQYETIAGLHKLSARTEMLCLNLDDVSETVVENSGQLWTYCRTVCTGRYSIALYRMQTDDALSTVSLEGVFCGWFMKLTVLRTDLGRQDDFAYMSQHPHLLNDSPWVLHRVATLSDSFNSGDYTPPDTITLYTAPPGTVVHGDFDNECLGGNSMDGSIFDLCCTGGVDAGLPLEVQVSTLIGAGLEVGKVYQLSNGGYYTYAGDDTVDFADSGPFVIGGPYDDCAAAVVTCACCDTLTVGMTDYAQILTGISFRLPFFTPPGFSPSDEIAAAYNATYTHGVTFYVPFTHLSSCSLTWIGPTLPYAAYAGEPTGGFFHVQVQIFLCSIFDDTTYTIDAVITIISDSLHENITVNEYQLVVAKPINCLNHAYPLVTIFGPDVQPGSPFNIETIGYLCNLDTMMGNFAMMAAAPRTAARDMSCQHRGEQLETRECQTCCGKTKIKVFACAVHGQCSIAKDVGVKVCLQCSDRLAAS